MLLALVSTLLAEEPWAYEAAESAIEKGRVLIRDLYEEQALEVLLPFLDDEKLDKGLRSRALIYAGIAHMNLSHEAEAKAMFRRALEVDIGAVLPEWVSRKVRDVFTVELERESWKRNPPPPPTVTRSQRHPWVGPALLAGVVVSAAVSLFGFVRWSDSYAQYHREPVAVDAERLYRGGIPYYWLGDVAAGLGAALLAVALGWWLWPSAE